MEENGISSIEQPAAPDEFKTPTPSDEDLCVYVLAPFGRDSDLIQDAFTEADLQCQVCRDVSDLPAMDKIGVVILTAEALTPCALAQINEAMDKQPTWSSTPVIFLLRQNLPRLDPDHRDEAIRFASHTIVLMRPVHSATLVSVTRTALDGRRWQYMVRDSLDWDVRMIRKIRKANASLEEAVAQRTAQLRAAAAELIIAEVRERRRLSYVLHDDYQQLLAAALMQLSLLAKCNDKVQSQEIVKSVVDSIHLSIGTARSLAKDLCPPALDLKGLVIAVRHLGEQLIENHGLVVDVDAEEAVELIDVYLRSFIYQIVRELLFNVVKHAHTDKARVTMRRDEQQFYLTIEDDGVGMSPKRSISGKEDQGGLGLPSIEHRVKLLGGSFHIGPNGNCGCKVSVVTPIRVAKESLLP